jgi:TrmH family RNA methyltransferase
MHSREISSLQHPLIKHLVKLREKKEYRYECKRVLISGKKLIHELSGKEKFPTLLVEEGNQSPLKADEIFYVSKEILKKVTGVQSPEPFAAEIDMPLSQDLSFANYLLVLDGISDPGNLGTLVRTAKALGWDGVFLMKSCTDLFNEKAVRAAKGATFSLPFQIGSWEELHALLQKRKMTLLAADASGKNVAECKATPPMALVLGNESHGLSEEIKTKASLIAIPMQQRMESLNVASAGAILMYTLQGKL